MHNNIKDEVNNSERSIIILGSTGSVGTQGLDVAKYLGIKVEALSASSNVKMIAEQAREFKVKYCAMADKNAATELKSVLADTDVKVFAGEDGICEMIELCESNFALNSIIGSAGLRPTLAVISSGKKLALANKESLVVAGDVVMATAREKGVEILPVDSELSAIWQSISANRKEDIKRLHLTASGGPFFGMKRDELKLITPKRALAHPTWKMGPKITIDSSTLMNKGFEVIESSHLFNIHPRDINVVVHRESIIHSMVEYIDNAVIAQLSVPDMRLCVQYAISAPGRIVGDIAPLDLAKISKLTFFEPDEDTFVLLRTAKNAIAQGGAVPCVLNAANEIAVEKFLNEKIAFYDIFDVVTQTVEDLSYVSTFRGLKEIFEADKLAREYALELCSKIQK